MRILFFGDSICAGSNIPDGGPETAWPMLFAQTHPELTVFNCSRGGRPTDSLSEFQEALATAVPCDVLVLALGANDARDVEAGMTARATNNLKAMLRQARAAGIHRMILVGPYNISPEHLGASYPIRHQRQNNLLLLDQAFRRLALEAGLDYLPMYGVIPEASLHADGVHPDVAGNRIVFGSFDRFWRQIAGTVAP